jgi:signal transduction histidine kinase/DNA-binding response OmpR family regulator
LPPGRYQFYVQGSNGEGPWQDAATVLRIVIRPPWWRSDAACTAYVLLLGLFVWQIYRFQVRRLRLREQLAFEHREAERIREMEQMKTNFFSNVTHEFRTPLTLMLEPLRQLIQNPADKALPEKLRLVERNSLRLLSLVNQLLDLSKIEHGGMQLQPKMGDLMQTVQSILPAFESLAHAKKIELQDLGGETPLYTLYDPEKVELVLNNLLSNALKFTPEGGRVRLKIQWDAEAEQVQMVVEDNGPGIAAAYVDKIFDRFFQAPDAPVTGGAGTGIGLALSKELAQLMGGDIRVQTRVGAGSVFTFTLPIVALPHAPDATEAPTADMPLALVIDDSEDMRMFLQMSLQGSWRVLAAANGEEGIAQATAALPDVIVSDLVMPGKSGHEVCIALKHSDLTAHIPIILLTAKSNLSDRLQGLAAGADDYLAKPFHTVELKTRMENLLENRRRLKRLFEGVPVLRGEAYEEKPFLSAADNAFLMRFTQIISDHLDDETLGVEEFAAKMYISRVQLHRKLKALTGTSATDFIRNYRLDRAWHMLRQKEGLVSEIATRTGFANEKYFSTVFKEKFGVSPSAV